MSFLLFGPNIRQHIAQSGEQTVTSRLEKPMSATAGKAMPKIEPTIGGSGTCETERHRVGADAVRGHLVWRHIGSFHQTHSDEGTVILAIYRKPNVFQHSAGYARKTAQ
jgi:hypothetical protein